MKILPLDYLPGRSRDTKKDERQKEKRRCKVDREKRKALFMAVTI
jgi:hypothetical protein